VTVIDHESRYINLTFDLKEGGLTTCNLQSDVDPNRPWQDYLGVYLDEQCEGMAYDGVDYPTGARDLVWAEGKIWYTSTENCFIAQGYGRDIVLDQCFKGIVGLMCPFEEVPEWVQNLLPNPPYTLEMAYD